MRFFLITCTLLFIGVTSSYSQNRKTVEYDFAKKELRGAIPFDQPFNVKCVNVPDDIYDVCITIFDVNRIDYKGLWEKNQPLSDSSLKANKAACTLFFQTERHQRHSDTLNIPVVVFLRPNSSYHIKMSGTQYIELTEEEIQKAVDSIMADKRFAATHNTILLNLALDSSASKSWSQKHDEINTAANLAVKKVDENYIVTGDNYEKQFRTFLTQVSAVNQIRRELLSHKKGMYGKALSLLRDNAGKSTMIMVDHETKIIEAQKRIADLTKLINETEKTQRTSALLTSKSEEETKLASLQLKTDSIKKEIAKAIENINKIKLAKNPSVSDLSIKVANKMKKIDWFNAGKDEMNFVSEFESDLQSIDIPILTDGEKSAFAKDMALRFQKMIDKPLDDFLAGREKYKDSIRVKLQKNTFSHSEIGNTFPTSLEERFKMHVTLDLGYAYVGRISRFNLYAGMNIYFRAIDTALPLSNYRGKWLRDFVGSRASLLLGVSLGSVKKEGVRRGIISDDMALISGMGFRLLSFFKVNTGLYFFYQYPRNALAYNKDNYRVKTAPFVSFSLDFNIQSFLKSFGNGHVAQIFNQ